MKTIRQINIENRQDYLFNDMTDINDFDPNFLNIDEVLFESNELIMYDIKYIKNLNSSDSLYLVFNNLYAYIEKSGENRYLTFASTEKYKIMLKNYIELWDEIKEKIELITGDKVILNCVCVVIVSSIFKEDNEYHSQVLLHDCFYEYEEHFNPLVVN